MVGGGVYGPKHGPAQAVPPPRARREDGWMDTPDGDGGRVRGTCVPVRNRAKKVGAAIYAGRGMILRWSWDL